MKAWDNFLILQEIELGKSTIAKWLRPLKIIKFDACNLYLEAKDSFQVLWFEEHIRSKVKTRLLNNNNKIIKIHLKVAGEKSPPPNQANLKKGDSKNHSPFRMSFNNIDPNHTFENFISNTNNEVPAKVIAEIVGYDLESKILKPPPADGPMFNPLFIFGEAGMGKSHLLMAATHILRRHGKNVIYSRSETFTEHVVSAIRAGEMSTFRQAYRNVDALIIDDIHLFSRKGATQEEFFHTFNTLHLARKLIILSSNCAPTSLQHIEPRLISRFEWGIALDIQAYTKDHAREILEFKAHALNFKLRKPIAEFLIESFHNTASTTRALEALILRTHLKNKSPHFSPTALTIPMVKHILTDLIVEEEQKALTPERIIKAVSEDYGITTDDILGKSQSRECALPRQVAMFLCRHELNLPFMKIGDIFNRDHSTVMSSVKRIKSLVETENHELGAICRKLKKSLNETRN
jgi:chromosomal replication initiator protein